MAAMNTLIFPVKDLDAAKAVFTTLLGAEPHTDQPYYVGYNVDGQEFALDPNGHRKGLTGAVPYWSVDDIAGRISALVAAGARVVQEPTDVGGGRRTAVLFDADGNHIGLMQDS
jgi:predicted enzyme related to lactoylglutathione lyase